MRSELPEGWKRSTLGEVMRMRSGKRPAEVSDEGQVPVIGANGLMGYTDSPLMEQPVITIGRVGACGAIHKTTGPAWLSDNTLIAVPSDLVDPTFLFYLLLTTDFLPVVTGSTQPLLTQKGIKALPCAVPPLAEQRRIAWVLGSLDDKIELNRRIAETLEQIAAAIFKARFVDFVGVEEFEESEIGPIPKGWEVSSLSSCFEKTVGGVWGTETPTNEDAVGVRVLRGIDLASIDAGEIPDVPKRWISAKQLTTRRLLSGDVLIEASGSNCGRSLSYCEAYAQLFDEPLVYSNFCKRLRPIHSDDPRALIATLFLRDAARSGHIAEYRTGSAVPNLDVDALLKGFRFALPQDGDAVRDELLLTLDRNTELRTEARSLAAIRDTLLPKLISGELRVPEEFEPATQNESETTVNSNAANPAPRASETAPTDPETIPADPSTEPAPSVNSETTPAAPANEKAASGASEEGRVR